MTHLAPLLLFCVSAGLTPGPNNIMLMSSSLTFGLKKSLPHFMGIFLGFPFMIIVVGLGLGSLFTQYPILQHALKILGAIYMLFLAWQMTRHSTHQQDGRKPLRFYQAALFQWANPKAWIMGIGALSIFMTDQSMSYFQQTLFIALIYGMTCFVCTGSWLVFGSFLNRIIKNPQQQRRFNQLMAFFLVLSIISIF